MAVVFAVVAGVFVVLSFGLGVQSRWLPGLFVFGGFSSALAGFVGMRTATRASGRTAHAARTSLGEALKIAFRSGAVMGLTVVGLALLNVWLWLAVLAWLLPELPEGGHLIAVTTTALGFGMGASLQALFARVGGGIFTKAADVGADLVGKVEEGIPEDDPRNPATIADNVGDNVGDVAGMGADLFESYCGALLAACSLGAATFRSDPGLQLRAVLAPQAVAAAGILVSIAGALSVRSTENATQKQLLAALDRGVDLSSGLVAVSVLAIVHLLGLPNPWGLWGAVVVGLGSGMAIGRSSEYFTSSSRPPTRALSAQAKAGPAPLIISGIAVGMMSTTVPVVAVALSVVFAFLLATGFSLADPGMGLYGISLAAVGMLSTLGITLATDAYGPIADNAGGNVQMSGLEAEVRQRTDALDALGNTTAAQGKGFAIGSAALTALALLVSYVEVVRVALLRAGTSELALEEGAVPTAQASLPELMRFFGVDLLNPMLLVSLFLGAMVAFLFSGLTLQAVGRAAGKMVEEVRSQFAARPGILEGTDRPDYARCVAIATAGAQREMLLPSCLAVLTPVVVGLLFGVAGVIGLLVGGLSTGFVLAVFLANTGAAWDNAKKYVEEGHHGGKGSPTHKATVVADTVGDPFKDTSGPSLNILLKLMSIVAIVMAGVTIAFGPG